MQLKKCIDEVIAASPRELGCTIEEIENEIRCKKSAEIDLENTEFTTQFRAAIKNGVNKRRYVKEGKYYRIATFPQVKVINIYSLSVTCAVLHFLI